MSALKQRAARHRGRGLAVWQSSQENFNGLVSLYGTLGFRGSMSRRFGDPPSCLTCTRPGYSVAIASHGFLWQTICRLPSPPLFFFWVGSRTNGSITRTISQVRVSRVSINFLLLRSKPENRYLSDLRRCDGYRDSWSPIPAKSCVSHNFLDSPACRPFVFLPLRPPPPCRARRRRTQRSPSYPSHC